MVTHGHGDGAYAHYSNELWPNDSNFTVSSLARLLRTLKRPPSRDSKGLFEYPPYNDFFCKLLRGKSRCLEALPLLLDLPLRYSSPSPKNCISNSTIVPGTNKNRFVMAYLSLLTAIKVFKEIQVGFLMVGHTHEDIDAYFRYLSKKLKNANTFVFPDLMKEFMTSRHLPFVPQLIQEVADFKAFIKDYHHDGASVLKGIIDMDLFQFYVDDQGWPVMQYKKSSTNADWLPKVNPIRMWKEDANKNPKLPLGKSFPVQPNPIWGCTLPPPIPHLTIPKRTLPNSRPPKNANSTFSRAYKNTLIFGEPTCPAMKRMLGTCIAMSNTGKISWKNFIDLHLQPRLLFLKVFGPTLIGPPPLLLSMITVGNSILWTSMSLPRMSSLNPIVGLKTNNLVIHTILGVMSLLEILFLSVLVILSSFRFGWEELPTVVHDKNDTNYGNCLLQWWRPDRGGKHCVDNKHRHINCWNSSWKIEDREPEWVACSSVLYSSRPCANTTDDSIEKISKRDAKVAMANLEEAMCTTPRTTLCLLVTFSNSMYKIPQCSLFTSMCQWSCPFFKCIVLCSQCLYIQS